MLVTAPDGGIINDPVLVHPEENVWWMQLADSDAGLYAMGVASQAGWGTWSVHRRGGSEGDGESPD